MAIQEKSLASGVAQTGSTILPAESKHIRVAGWATNIKRSALQQMLTAASKPGILSLALGLPAPELFPVAAYSRATAQVLATDAVALQYGPPFHPLKHHIVSLMSQRGVACREEQIFLTTGAQQGLSLLTRLLLDPGDKVLVEEFTYPGFQQAIEPFQPHILQVPTSFETGIDVDAVERTLTNERPSLIYTVSNGHNPLAVNMSSAKRSRLVELARSYGVPIIEDDAYGFLSYEGQPSLPLRALDDQWVFYVGSFSKILAPALRVGWVIAPEEMIFKLSILKEASDIDTSTLNQRAIGALIDTGFLDQHIHMLRREYCSRRDTMLESLRQCFPSGARWRVPASGVFVWVELDGVDTSELLKLALETEHVAFIPGAAFSFDGQRGANCMRLNFSNSSPERIREGIKRLKSVVEQITRHPKS